MISVLFAVDRMDTWIFRASIAVPAVCLLGLLLWHLAGYLGGKGAKKPRAIRHALEPAPRLAEEQLRNSITSIRPSGSDETRAEWSGRAGDLLARAREEFNAQLFARCYERCKAVAALFPDLPQGAEAKQLVAQIKNDPDRLGQVCAALVESLADTYLDLAESWLRKGEPQQAAAAWEKVIQSCPETRQAQLARERLRQMGVAGQRS